MMKLISIIKSFLFGDTEQERTQDTTLREDIEFEERPQYIPPMDNIVTLDESEPILDTQSDYFDTSNIEDSTQASILVESQPDVEEQDNPLPLIHQLKHKDTSITESTQLQETVPVIPKIKEESLIQSFTELIEELDIVLTKAEDENSRQTIKFCQSRIIEILSNNGVESMEKDSIFDSTRHIPVPFKIVPNGTPIANIERIGLIYAGKVVLKAQVNI
nr:hypothetical protein [Bacteroides intestinalis]